MEAIYIPKAPKGREAPAPGSFELLEQHEGFGVDAARHFRASPKGPDDLFRKYSWGSYIDIGFRV